MGLKFRRLRELVRRNVGLEPPLIDLAIASTIMSYHHHHHHLIIIITSLILIIITSLFPGVMLSETVTLQSIEIFNTHEWLPGKLVVYFRCKEENKTVLPDVKNKHVVYHFKGEESWQPLTDLVSKKCKRCGLYEQDFLKSDGVFDEWELCLDDFRDSKYIRFKEKEFNATFLCPQCSSHSLPPHTTKAPRDDNREEEIRKHLVVVILVGVSGLVLVVGVVLVIYRQWQRRKRRQDQARFMQLFDDDGDDLEDHHLQLNYHHHRNYHHVRI